MAIKMSPEELRELATSITSTKEQIQELVGTMDSNIDSQTQEWDGSSKTQFFADYEEILPKIRDDFPLILETLASRLTFAADTLEQTDADIAEAFK